MYRGMWYAMAIAVAAGTALPALAQDSELSQLREELKRLQQRIEDLEKRREAPPASAATAPKAAAESTFNPGITLILQGTVARSSREPGRYAITGFAPSGGEVGPAPRGFGLGESELIVSGNVDPYFRGQLVAALTPENEVEVEEAFFQTLALGSGFTLKGGRFLSGIGYQNEIHQHAWDFQDAPLAYKAFLGGRLNDDGVQLRWVAPTQLFLELGAELARGRSFPDTERTRNGRAASSFFGHAGGDFGGGGSWRAGLSHLRASPRERAFEDLDSVGNPVVQAFSGTSRLWIADLVLKWPKVKLQGEYFRRREKGSLDYDGIASSGYASRQSGWYAQAVYQLMPRWRAGYRFDSLRHGKVSNGLPGAGVGLGAGDFPLLMSEHNPRRSTAMIDWSPTEFSRLRLQLAIDRSAQGITDRQALLQYIHSLGAHGAHGY